MKKIIYILILLIGITFTSFAQNTSAAQGDPAAKLIRFYPNPATTVINFDYQRGYDRSYSFQVYNYIGKLVYEVKNTPQRISINLDEFYRGFYYYKLIDMNGKTIETGRFLVVK